MTRTITHKPDRKLDLVLERVVDVPPDLVWAAWTRPDYVKKWFTPAPWQTVDCEIDLSPGGIFRTVMRSPEGQDFPNTGCYLEVVGNKKLVWTAALTAGYRPQNAPSVPLFTTVILLEPHRTGTKYTAIAIHGDEEGAKVHADMGFHDGWGKARPTRRPREEDVNARLGCARIRSAAESALIRVVRGAGRSGRCLSGETYQCRPSQPSCAPAERNPSQKCSRFAMVKLRARCWVTSTPGAPARH